MKKKISHVLKSARKTLGLSADYVVNELNRLGMKITSPKTLFGYENGVSQPKADMFLCLCKIYGITSFDIFFDEETVNQNIANEDPTIQLINKLDIEDKAEIRGAAKQLLKSYKYKKRKNIMKKNFITGVIVGGLVFGAAGAFAGQYVATDNYFPVTLNGERIPLNGYNIEGSTYFKLRDIADKLGSFTVDFQDNTICLLSSSKPLTNPSSPVYLNALNLSTAKTQDNLVIYTDEYENQYVKLTDLNSIVSDIGPGLFDMWIVSFHNGKWRIEYSDIQDDYFWDNDLCYAYTGGQLYICNGQYYITASDYINLVLPNLGLIDGRPNSKFEITDRSHDKYN